MSKYIVDLDTGSVVYAESCVLVDDGDMEWDSEEGFMDYAHMTGTPVLDLEKK